METDRETAVKETIEQENTAGGAAEGREDSIRREYSFAPDVRLKECRFCRVMIPKKAKVCPNCRMNLKRHWLRNLVAAVFAAAVIGVGGYYLSGHWGIMQDAVMSVWMAQKGATVPVVSVTTVDTAEMASGATVAEPSEVAVAAETDEKAGQEAAGEAGERAAEPKETAEIPKTEPEGAEELPEAEPKETPKRQETGSEKLAESQAGEPEEAEALQETESGPEMTESRTTAFNDGTSKDIVNKSGSAQEVSEENSKSTDTETADETAEYEEQKDSVPAEDRNQEEQAFRDGCTGVSYKSLLRDTETYLNTAIRVEAEVICQVNGGLFDENIYYFCMHEEKNGIKRYYIIRDDREADDTLILEGDMLTVYGQLFGSCKLPADLIETRPTVPAVSMLYFDLTEE